MALDPKEAERQEYGDKNTHADGTLPRPALQAAIIKRQPHQKQPDDSGNDENSKNRGRGRPILQILKDRNVVPLRSRQKDGVRWIGLGPKLRRQTPGKE